MASFTGGPNLNSVPSAGKQTLTGNFVDLANQGWAQQYLPELMEKEAEVFGNRTISGFLAQVGAEEGMASEQVVWSEQGRLHLAYTVQHVSEGKFLVTGNSEGASVATSYSNGIRKGDMVLLSDANSTARVYVTDTFDEQASGGSLTAGQFTAVSYKFDTVVNAGIAVATGVKAFVFGSEYGKGTNGRGKALEPNMKHFANNPIILKDKYEVSGSDASAIGWIEVSGEEGQAGYLWYLKAEGDTRARFADYCEMTLIEAEKARENYTGTTDSGAFGAGLQGTEGLFAAIEDRGNVANTFSGTATGMLADFDDILAEFDKNGAIEENMMFLNRATALKIDDMLATMNSYGGSGTSYGVFNNSEDMALNLGFSGFRRGSYDFYKTDWKYLNDVATRGQLNDATTGIDGVIIPAGVSSVYDQVLGKNLKRPFLHTRYRASQTESRKMKTWTTGSVGASTSDLDAMEVHYLSERCLVVQGANNFMLMVA